MRLKLTCKHCRRNVEIEGDGHVPAIECPNCKVVINLPSNILDVDSELGGFKIIRHLGSGSMGCVYLAKQVSMDRDVAVKVLPPEVRSRQEELDNFMKEVRLLAKLDHPNIVTAFEAGNVDDNYYMAMTYVQGETLEDKIKRDGPLDEVEALTVARKISEALRYAWEKHKILHRDVKPENIMVDDRNSEPKLLDMGISMVLNDEPSESEAGILVGTPHYMSPEQAKSQDIDFRADMYSLGCSLYQFLTGKVPYDSENVMNVLTKHALDPIPNPKELNSQIHQSTIDLIKRLMAKSPDNRFGDWGDLIKEIRRAVRAVKNNEPPKVRRKTLSSKGDRGVSTRADEVLARMHEEEFKEPPAEKKLTSMLTVILVVILAVIVAVVGAMKLSSSGGGASDDDKTSGSDKDGTVETGTRAKIEEARRKLEEKRLAKKREAEEGNRRRLAMLERRFARMVAKDPTKPHSFEPVIKSYRTLLANAKGTPTEAKIQAHIQTLLARQATDTERVLAELKATAAPMIKAANYKGAVDLYRNYVGSCTYETSVKRQEIIQWLLRQQARQLEAKLEFDRFLEKAANLLANGQYDKAATFAKPFMSRKGAFGAEATLIHDVAQMDALILKSFVSSVGKETTVPLLKKVERVKITKIEDGTVHSYKEIDFHGSIGKETVYIKPQDIHPNERLKRLKNVASPDSYAFMKGLIALEVKKYAIARAELGRSSTSLAKKLKEYVEIKSGNSEEWAEVEFKVLLKSLGLKEGELTEMNAEVMKLTPSPTERVLLRQSLEVFLFRFGQTRKARKFGSFLFLLKDLLTDAEPIDQALIEGVLTEIRNVNRMKSLKSTVKPVVGGIRLDLAGNSNLDRLVSLEKLHVRELVVADTSFVDLASLATIPLRSLDLSNTRLRSLKSLKCPLLQTLSIASTQVKYLPDLRQFSVLTTLDASGTPLASLKGLTGSTLNTLNLSGCDDIRDVSPLFEMPNLKTLIISDKIPGFYRLMRLAQVERIGLDKDTLRPAKAFWAEAITKGSRAMRAAQEANVRAAVANLIQRHANPDLEFNELIKKVSYHPTGIELNFWWERDVKDLSDFRNIPVAILRLDRSGVTNLEPFQNSPVEIFTATQTKIASLAPLANAPLLEVDTRWSTCNPLLFVKGWPHLRSLKCNGSSLSTLDLFKDTALDELSLLGGKFRDLTPLVNNPIRSLRIEDGSLSDLSPLADCDRLERLHIARTQVSELGPIASLSLKSLDVSGTRVRSLTPIKGDVLDGLWITDTTISDLSPLDKAQLRTFHADNSSITDISVLSKMPIRDMHVGDTKILDFTAIGTFDQLSNLWIHNTAFANLELLRGKPLRELRLDGCAGIGNVEPLLAFNRLERVTVPRRDVEGLWSLARLPRLRRISHAYDHWRTRPEEYFE